MKIKPKSSLKWMSTILGTILLLSIILFHNDDLNRKLNSKNYLFVNYLGFDCYNNLESIAKTFDFKGKFQKLTSPLSKTDFIEIKIEKKALELLNQNGRIGQKIWVKAKVLVDGNYENAKIKIHGSDAIHFASNKFSMRVKMDKDAAWLEGKRIFNLIIGKEADPTVAAANKLANDYGLIAPCGKMVMVTVNDMLYGHYYFVDHLSDEYLLQKHQIKKYAKLENIKDWDAKGRQKYGSNHISDHDLFVGHIEKKKNPLFPKALRAYKTMTDALLDNNLKQFINFFDTQYMAKYLSILALFNDNHHATGDNLKLIYDFNAQKFYPVYRQEYGYRDFDWRIYNREDLWAISFPNFNELVFERSLEMHSQAKNALIFKCMLSIDSIRHKRDKFLFELISQKSNLIDSIKTCHKRNDLIMLHADVSRRAYNFCKKNQIGIVSKVLSLGNEYLNYLHAYSTHDLLNNEIIMAIDAYSKVGIETKHNNYDFHGIQFDCDLNTKYQYIKIPFDSSISIYNKVTGEAIKPTYYYQNKMQ